MWFRDKAVELRSLAEAMQVAGARSTMLGLAGSYDAVADYLERNPAPKDRAG
jgi:hypothetical protein